MRIIQIPNLDYPTFYEIRLEILRKVPFALINTEYLKEDNVAFFYFWDSDYIPEEFRKYIIKPPNEVKFDFSKIKLPEV